MIYCLIIDDEPLAREVLRLYLSRLPGWAIAAECENAAQALEALKAHPVQVIFLDIQMPKILGTDFLRSLNRPPKVIFTTAHPGFAVEGFELNAVDYLLKPITFERFADAVKKIEQAIVPEAPRSELAKKDSSADEFMFIRQDNRQVKVLFSDILFLEAKRDFTSIQLRDKKLLAGFHLKMVEGILPASQFMRIHRSYIVKLSAIDAVYGNTVELRGFQVPVGPAQKEELASKLGL